MLNGIVGAAGLRATMATLEAGATLALANKESMVAGGPFVLDAARRSGSLILPVDSEHSALFQCLLAGGERAGERPALAPAGPAGAPRRAAAHIPGAAPTSAAEELLLTGSGGPFRGRTAADLAAVTPEQALKHPNWSMGPKITIDSATLMNKGLEIIEAHYLFGVPYERITVVISPQSIGAQHGALRRRRHLRAPRRARHAHAHRLRARVPAAAVAAGGQEARRVRHRAHLQQAGQGDVPLPGAGRGGRHGRGCGGAGERRAAGPAQSGAAAGPRTVAAPIVLNAANEVAVQAFLDGPSASPRIAEVVEKCLTWLGDEPVESLEDVYACDEEARRFAREAVAGPD